MAASVFPFCCFPSQGGQTKIYTCPTLIFLLKNNKYYDWMKLKDTKLHLHINDRQGLMKSVEHFVYSVSSIKFLFDV